MMDYVNLLTSRPLSDNESSFNHSPPTSPLSSIQSSIKAPPILEEKTTQEMDVGEVGDNSLRLPPLSLSLVDQPPDRCVYKRNVKPPPVVGIEVGR